MKQTVLLILTFLTPLFSISIEFQSKLYITPKGDANYVWKLSKDTLCVQAKYGVYGIDISNLKQPKILKKSSCYEFQKFASERDDESLVKKWGLIQGIKYSSDKKTKFIWKSSVIFVLDISNLKNEKIIGEYVVFEWENHMYISDILFSNTERYAYVLNSISGVQIYDMSDINHFKTLGKLEEGIGIDVDEISEFYIIDDKYLLARDGCTIIDIGNKMKPKLIDNTFTKAEHELLILDKKHIIASYQNGSTYFIDIYDISNFLKPKQVYHFKIEDSKHDIIVDRDRIFFLGDKGLQIYKVKR